MARRGTTISDLPREERLVESDQSEDRRTSAQRDYARVLYSPHFQRLAGVTQVVPPDPRVPHIHNRLTHSMKVALVAGEIADDFCRRAKADARLGAAIERMGGIEPDVCRTAGLAHDLGHPPFGHLGETMLNLFLTGQAPFREMSAPAEPRMHRTAPGRRGRGLLRGVEGFEGNAQTFRIVTRLDRHCFDEYDGASTGLDLTRATLAAVLKYPWAKVEGGEHKSEKYGVYPEDLARFRWAREWVDPLVGVGVQSLEASVMDLADDVTYAIHDLQDFVLAGIVDSQEVSKALRQQIGLMGKSDYVDFGGARKAQISRRREFERRSGRVPPALEMAYRKLCLEDAGRARSELFVDALHWVADIFENDIASPVRGTGRQQVQIRKALGGVIGTLLADLSLTEGETSLERRLRPSLDSWHRISVLKALGRDFVVQNPHVSSLQRSQQRAIAILLNRIDEWLLDAPPIKELPEPLRSYLRDADRSARESSRVRYDGYVTRHAIADFVCSMTDFQAMRWAEWLEGRTLPILGDV